MKRAIYYASSFIILPMAFFAVTLLESKNIINSNSLSVLVCIVIFVFAALMGSLSPTNKRFDYLMTAIMPSSCLLALFIGLFFDQGCDGKPQLSLSHALNIEYYKPWLPIVIGMIIITFVFSFKPIRFLSKASRSGNNHKK